MKHPFLAAFERCEAMLKPAVDRFGQVTMADVANAVLEGRAQIWPAPDAAIITQLVKTEGGGVIHIWLGCGDLPTLLTMLPGVEAYGRAWGCIAITTKGRKGWKRVLAPHGYSGDDMLRKAL